MQIKAYHAFFKGDHQAAQQGLERLDKMRISLGDVRCLFRRNVSFHSPKATYYDVAIRIKRRGRWIKESTLTLLSEQTSGRA